MSAAETLFETDAAVDSLAVVQIGVIKALVDRLAELDLSPLHLRIDTKRVSDTRPDISMWMQTRTDFERLCTALKLKATEARYSPQGQRLWHANHDTAERRLLVQVVSLAHHDDWQERPPPT